MKNKLYTCENPECNREVVIRSVIKAGLSKGLKVCQYCKLKLEIKTKEKQAVAPLKKFTSKTLEKRRSDREGLPTFFAEMAKELAKRPICENCGASIDYWKFPFSNCAHILMKSRYKSVMTNKNNILFLCCTKDTNGNSCHEKFDSSISAREQMYCFAIAKERYQLFKDQVIEYGKERISLEG